MRVFVSTHNKEPKNVYFYVLIELKPQISIAAATVPRASIMRPVCRPSSTTDKTTATHEDNGESAVLDRVLGAVQSPLKSPFVWQKKERWQGFVAPSRHTTPN